jgi:4-carboxymuconolactone decarboxylase
MNQDLKIALESASELDFPVPIGSTVGQLWQLAVSRGFSSESHTAIYVYLEELPRDVNKILKEMHMATQEEKQAYIDEMARKRGYVLDYHKVMTEYDFEVLQATNALVDQAYLKERRLDRKTKELIFIVSLTVMRAGKGHIASHIRVALDLGLSKEEILEAIEVAIPEAGIVAFQAGFEAWREVTGAEGIEPSIEVHEGGSGSD